MQNYMDDDNEATETLSLCDLPLHNDAASLEEHPLESSSSSSSSSSSFDQDLFEFFTGEWRSPSSNIAPENILFCGKLIPSKRPIPRRNSDSSFYKRTSKSASSSTIATTPRSNSLPFPINANQMGISTGKNDVLPKKVSLLTSTPTKSRWFVFMFGMSILPKKMELSDLRDRQSRRSGLPTMFQSDGSDDKELVGGGHHTNTARKFSFGCFGGL